MINNLKPKSEFSRNVLTLMTGTTIAQAIPIAISPILTRIYTPEDFGVFALYMSITSIVAVFATGRYELAIMLPKKDENAVNIVALSILITFAISFIAFLIIFIFNSQITSLFTNPKISNWLYFIPVSIILTGLYQSFNYWSNRKKQYKRLATSRVTRSTITSVNTLVMGFSKFGTSGLILGTISGQAIATIILGKLIWNEDKILFKKIKQIKMFALARKYIAFPKLNASHAMLNTFSSHLPIFLISYFFHIAGVGFYALASRVLLSPMGIVTSSYGQVFLQEITRYHNSKENGEVFLKKTMYKLLLHSFPIFIVLFLFSPELFSIIFSQEWHTAGIYAQILIPMLYLRFTGSIVSSVTIVYNKQKKALVLEILNTVLRFFALVIGGIFDNIILGLILFSLFSSLITLYRLFWYLKIIRGFNK